MKQCLPPKTDNDDDEEGETAEGSKGGGDYDDTVSMVPSIYFGVHGVVTLNAIDVVLIKLGLELTLDLVSLAVPLSLMMNSKRKAVGAMLAPEVHTLKGNVAVVATIGIGPFSWNWRLPAFAWDGVGFILPSICFEFVYPDVSDLVGNLLQGASSSSSASSGSGSTADGEAKQAAGVCPPSIPKKPADLQGSADPVARAGNTRVCSPCIVETDANFNTEAVKCEGYPFRSASIGGIGKMLRGKWIAEEWEKIASQIVAAKPGFARYWHPPTGPYAGGDKESADGDDMLEGDTATGAGEYQKQRPHIWMADSIAICDESFDMSTSSNAHKHGEGEESWIDEQPGNLFTTYTYKATLAVRFAYDWWGEDAVVWEQQAHWCGIWNNCEDNYFKHWNQNAWISEPRDRPAFEFAITAHLGTKQQSGGGGIFGALTSLVGSGGGSVKTHRNVRMVSMYLGGTEMSKSTPTAGSGSSSGSGSGGGGSDGSDKGDTGDGGGGAGDGSSSSADEDPSLLLEMFAQNARRARRTGMMTTTSKREGGGSKSESVLPEEDENWHMDVGVHGHRMHGRQAKLRALARREQARKFAEAAAAAGATKSEQRQQPQQQPQPPQQQQQLSSLPMTTAVAPRFSGWSLSGMVGSIGSAIVNGAKKVGGAVAKVGGAITGAAKAMVGLKVAVGSGSGSGSGEMVPFDPDKLNHSPCKAVSNWYRKLELMQGGALVPPVQKGATFVPHPLSQKTNEGEHGPKEHTLDKVPVTREAPGIDEGDTVYRAFLWSHGEGNVAMEYDDALDSWNLGSTPDIDGQIGGAHSDKIALIKFAHDGKDDNGGDEDDDDADDEDDNASGGGSRLTTGRCYECVRRGSLISNRTTGIDDADDIHGQHGWAQDENGDNFLCPEWPHRVELAKMVLEATDDDILASHGILEGKLVEMVTDALISEEMGVPVSSGGAPGKGYTGQMRVGICGETFDPGKRGEEDGGEGGGGDGGGGDGPTYSGRVVLVTTKGWNVESPVYLDPADSNRAVGQFTIKLNGYGGHGKAGKKPYIARADGQPPGAPGDPIELRPRAQGGSGYQNGLDQVAALYWSHVLQKQGKTKACQPSLEIRDADRDDFKMFDAPLRSLSQLRTSGTCFKCTAPPGGFLGFGKSDVPIYCGREKASLFATSPVQLPNRVGPLAVDWFKKEWNDGCDFWSGCHQLDLMDRAAGRAFNHKFTPFTPSPQDEPYAGADGSSSSGSSSAANGAGGGSSSGGGGGGDPNKPFTFATPQDVWKNGGSIYVCGESTWTVGGEDAPVRSKSSSEPAHGESCSYDPAPPTPLSSGGSSSGNGGSVPRFEERPRWQQHPSDRVDHIEKKKRAPYGNRASPVDRLTRFARARATAAAGDADNSDGGSGGDGTNLPGFGPNTKGRHFGGVLCVLVGSQTQCVYYRTGAGALTSEDGTGGGVLGGFFGGGDRPPKQCSAWEGGYFESRVVPAASDGNWHFLAMKHSQLAARKRATNRALARCSSEEKVEEAKHDGSNGTNATNSTAAAGVGKGGRTGEGATESSEGADGDEGNGGSDGGASDDSGARFSYGTDRRRPGDDGHGTRSTSGGSSSGNRPSYDDTGAGAGVSAEAVGDELRRLQRMG
jgi:hypothetical protein